MDITKRKLKKIIKEEMNILANSGDITLVSESEKEVFALILEKLTPEQLKAFGLKKTS